MASIPPQRLTVDKIVKDLLEPATTSFYQVTIKDPKQLNENGDSFSDYLRQQGLSILFYPGLDVPRKEKLQLFCSEEITTVLFRGNTARLINGNSKLR